MKVFQNKLVPLLYLGITIVFFSCKKEDNTTITIPSKGALVPNSSTLYQEQFRPQFHFTPQKNWMNDPNGMLYYKGIYHLFYQYYPKDIVWGPMHWGHATSTDLIHWKHQKIALYPDKLGLIFSGSAVMDSSNSSGLGTTANPPMIAIFTYHNLGIEKAKGIKMQSQGLAYSLDEGTTWTKYTRNPIIANPNLKDFRDPKVFWNPETKLWNLVLVAGDHAQFYNSSNLLNWKLTGEFGKNNGAHGGVWECPDLFKLKVANSTQEKWVLLISINPGAPNGGSGTQYFIGDYDGKTFTTTQKETRWIDNGTDNYAGVTYNNAPDNKRIFVGWMSNWSYAIKTPTKNWRSAMTLPRELSLVKINGHFILKSTPIPAIKNQFEVALYKNLLPIKANQKTTFEYLNFNQSQIQFDAEAKNLKLVFSNAASDSLVLNYDKTSKAFSIDRTHSGMTTFEKSFGERVHTTSIFERNSPSSNYQIILDWSSIEIFLDGGLYSFTEQIFPKQPYTKLTVSSDENIVIKDLKINAVKGIWDKK